MARLSRPFTSMERRWDAVVDKHRNEFTQVREIELGRASIRLPQGRFFVAVTEQKNFDRIAETVPDSVLTRRLSSSTRTSPASCTRPATSTRWAASCLSRIERHAAAGQLELATCVKPNCWNDLADRSGPAANKNQIGIVPFTEKTLLLAGDPELVGAARDLNADPAAKDASGADSVRLAERRSTFGNGRRVGGR
ncbi:hypothetical protein Pla108_18610 [Botrimarina colliarenosi]|uniref:Uncharacterized protein n=1 Tax=Botrimarina colliarenosi TaxID=2528001 RepID=A0A5C6ADL7_9BACT|nr:hypothetical protein Pla108_18610 [Botrimarina colliarenosi]